MVPLVAALGFLSACARRPGARFTQGSVDQRKCLWTPRMRRRYRPPLPWLTRPFQIVTGSVSTHPCRFVMKSLSRLGTESPYQADREDRAPAVEHQHGVTLRAGLGVAVHRMRRPGGTGHDRVLRMRAVGALSEASTATVQFPLLSSTSRTCIARCIALAAFGWHSLRNVSEPSTTVTAWSFEGVCSTQHSMILLVEPCSCHTGLAISIDLVSNGDEIMARRDRACDARSASRVRCSADIGIGCRAAAARSRAPPPTVRRPSGGRSVQERAHHTPPHLGATNRAPENTPLLLLTERERWGLPRRRMWQVRRLGRTHRDGQRDRWAWVSRRRAGFPMNTCLLGVDEEPAYTPHLRKSSGTTRRGPVRIRRTTSGFS